MKIKSQLLSVLALFIVVGAFSQKTDKETISYYYQRNPLVYLDPSVTNYQVEVEVTWAEEQNRKLEAYEAEKAEAEQDYQEALAKYNSRDTKSKIAEGVAGALLDVNTKPVKRHVAKPVTYPLPDSGQIVASVKLDGFKSDFDNAVSIQIVYHQIEVGQPTKSERVKDEVTYKSQKVIVKQPVEYSVISPDGEVLLNQMLAYSEKGFTVSSGDKKAGKEWNDYLAHNWKKQLNSSIAKYHKDLAKRICDDVNYQYGYCKVKKDSRLYMGKGKKFTYESHMLALRKAQRAYESLFNERDASVEAITEAIGIWEQELEEAKPTDKKARISAEVTQALYVNIIEASILIGDYDKAMDYCDKMDIFPDAKRKYANNAEDLRKFLKDEKSRNPID